MTSYEVHVLPDEPILLAISFADFSVTHDQAKIEAEVRSILENSAEPLLAIIDVDQVKMGLDDVIHGANVSSRGEKPLWHHPKIREIIWVTTSPLIKLAVKGLDSVVFGNIKATAFDTQEEAIEYARSRLKG